MTKTLTLALAAVLFATSAHAAETKRKAESQVEQTQEAIKGTGTYGLAGCGLGSMAFGDSPGAVQIFAATTNGLFGTQTFAHADPRRYALVLLSSAFGGGMSSRLFQTVREELGLAYAVHTFQSTHVDAGMHGVYLATAPGTGAKAYDAVRRELARLTAEGLPDDELAAARRQLRGQVTLGADGVTNAMYRAAGLVLYGEPYRPLDEVLARVDAVTADDVRAVCRDFFDPDRQTVLSLGPKPVQGRRPGREAAG